MAKDDTEKLKKHVIGIKGLISNPELVSLAKKTGRIGQSLITNHVNDGRFLGGEYRNKPYSTADLPLFFFGDFEIVERTGNIRINNPELRKSNVLIPKKDVRWRTTQSGKKYAYLKGGYATWLRKTRPGKSLTKVNLQYNGDMMRALTYETVVHGTGAEVRWYVRSPHDRKAAYTHAKRNWLGFFPEEVDTIIEMAREEFSVIIAKTVQ